MMRNRQGMEAMVGGTGDGARRRPQQTLDTYTYIWTHILVYIPGELVAKYQQRTALNEADDDGWYLYKYDINFPLSCQYFYWKTEWPILFWLPLNEWVIELDEFSDEIGCDFL